jgi:hypothetical protein
VNFVTDIKTGLGQNIATMQWIQIIQSLSGAWMILDTHLSNCDSLRISAVSLKRIFTRKNRTDGTNQNCSFDEVPTPRGGSPSPPRHEMIPKDKLVESTMEPYKKIFIL